MKVALKAIQDWWNEYKYKVKAIVLGLFGFVLIGAMVFLFMQIKPMETPAESIILTLILGIISSAGIVTGVYLIYKGYKTFVPLKK